MKKKSRKLTPEQEAFFAGFDRQTIQLPLNEPPGAGDVVRIIGKHPHAGKVGEVVGYKMCVGVGIGMEVRFTGGAPDVYKTGGCFIFERAHFEITKRNGPGGRAEIEALRRTA